MKNLMSHCGTVPITLEELSNIDPPLPSGKDPEKPTYFPIKHYHLRGLIGDELKGRGVEIAKESIVISPDKMMVFGVIEIANGNGIATMIGWRNFNDGQTKKFPAGLVAGSKVFVCDNLCFSGEIKIARRHTKRILEDLPNQVSDAVSKLPMAIAKQNLLYERLKGTPMLDYSANDMMVRAMERKIIPSSSIQKVHCEWHNPSYEEFEERTAWSLFNAFTFTLKGRFDKNINTTTAESIRLHALFNENWGDEDTNIEEGKDNERNDGVI